MAADHSALLISEEFSGGRYVRAFGFSSHDTRYDVDRTLLGRRQSFDIPELTLVQFDGLSVVTHDGINQDVLLRDPGNLPRRGYRRTTSNANWVETQINELYFYHLLSTSFKR
ncbi:MAG: hypothetical protein QF645_07190 [Planctomycetota bacterium]|nr:hypothetical protein [Planctomycetota bacterium]